MPSCVRIKTEVDALRHRRRSSRRFNGESSYPLDSRSSAFHVSPTAFGISCPAVKGMNRLFVLFLFAPRRSDAAARGRARRKSAEKSDGRFAGNWMLLFHAIFSHAAEQPSSFSFSCLLSNSFIPPSRYDEPSP